jgi:uncharacterized membrane protein YoaT (DUF817 family)
VGVLPVGFKEGWACLFGATLLALLLLTKWLWPAGIAFARYDFLFLSALAIQAMLLLFRMETVREAQIIFIFHVIGTAMELFKTNVGSWTYPEPSIFHIRACAALFRLYVRLDRQLSRAHHPDLRPALFALSRPAADGAARRADLRQLLHPSLSA